MGGPRKLYLTEKNKALIEELAKCGVTTYTLSQSLGISETTLRSNKEAMELFNRVQSKVIGKVAKSLLQKALDGNVAAMVFLLKTRGRWSEQTFIKIEDFKGDYEKKRKAIEKAFNKGFISVETYTSLTNTLNSEFKNVEQEERIKAIEKKVGVK